MRRTAHKTDTGTSIRFARARSKLGDVVVGATAHGVCCVLFLDEGVSAEDAVAAEFPSAERIADGTAGGHLEKALSMLEGRPGMDADRLPLDLVGTAFQRRVWAEVTAVPRGETVTYGQLAARVGNPRAARAIAGACAANHAAVVVPCHRVVRSGGGMGGYRWGVDRKRGLLSGEGVCA